MAVVLCPKGFDLDSIDKCFADVRSQFTSVEDLDSEITAREGQQFFFFLVLHKEYFTMYTRQYREGIKCGYQSRNMVMSQIHTVSFRQQYEKLKEDGENLEVVKVDDLLIWKEPPLMFFVNKKDIGKISGYYGPEANTVVVYFDQSSIQEFAQIVKTKKNIRKHVFIVYLENDTYQCFNTEDITINYKYGGRRRGRVVDMLRRDVNGIKELIKEGEELPKKKAKTKRDENFKLVDINGNEVDENKKYFLKVRQTEEWRNDEHDALDLFNNELIGVLSSEDLEVKCQVLDGITFIKHQNNYLYGKVAESECNCISTLSETPNKSDRLQFHLSTNNTFKITRWINHLYAA